MFMLKKKKKKEINVIWEIRISFLLLVYFINLLQFLTIKLVIIKGRFFFF